MRSLAIISGWDTLTHAVARCGSLRAGCFNRPPWSDLKSALAAGNQAKADDAAEAVCTAAVPEERSPYPLRALYETHGPSGVSFTTPGDVDVAIHHLGGDDWMLAVDFNRDSLALAGQMLAAICYNHGGYDARVHVDDQDAPTTAILALAHVASGMALKTALAQRPKPAPNAGRNGACDHASEAATA